MKSKKALLAIMLVIVATLGFVGFNSNKFEEKIELDLTLSSEERWIEDIDYLAQRMEKGHKNLYHTISKQKFRNELKKLKQNIANLSETDRLITLEQIISKIGDGHTKVYSRNEIGSLPISLKDFDDGVYITSTAEAYRDLLGNKIISINSVPIEKVIKIMENHIAADNDISKRKNAIFYTTMLNYLKFYNLIDNVEEVNVSMEDETGKIIERKLKKYNYKLQPAKWFSLYTKYSEIGNMSYVRNHRDKYRYEYYEKEKTIHFNYFSCSNNNVKTLEEFIPELVAFINEHDVEKFIFDVRMNGGGDSRLIEPLIKELKENKDINQKGHLYVAIGKRTFSSAILNSLKLKNETNAIFIGGKTGGSPAHYGEVVNFNLPYSKYLVSYARKYFASSVKENYIAPDIEVEYTFYDFIHGKDPVLERVLNNEI